MFILIYHLNKLTLYTRWILIKNNFSDKIINFKKEKYILKLVCGKGNVKEYNVINTIILFIDSN